MSIALPPFTVDDLAATLGSASAPVVLDVRDVSEAGRDLIPGTTILPRCRIEFGIGILVRDRTTPLVVVDSGDEVESGGRDPRAGLAAATLAELGYRAVVVLDGGMAAWRAAGLTIVSGALVSSTSFGRRIGDLARVPMADVPALQRWRAQGRRVALCDVRSAAEHTQGCIPGAVSMPGFEAVEHALDMAAESDLIVLCSSACTRSVVVARTLIDLGLNDVVALRGGTLAWRLAGQELERGSRRRRVEPSPTARQFAQLGSARLAKHHGVEGIEALDLAALPGADDRNFHAFDLRGRARHAVAGVPFAVQVDSDRLIVRNEEMIGARGAPIVLIDDDPVRAPLTAVWMRRLGHPQVRMLSGGFAAWARAGLACAPMATLALGWQAASTATPGLGVAEALQWLVAHAPARVLHVDTGASYRRAHLPGAVWLQRGWLEAHIAEIAPAPGQALLVCCDDGRQAAYAAATLHRRGHAQVAWLQGGTHAWAAAGRALETSELPSPDDELPLLARRDEQARRAAERWERLLEPRD
jgi:rhodanese-related sulfurtransferase